LPSFGGRLFEVKLVRPYHEQPHAEVTTFLPTAYLRVLKSVHRFTLLKEFAAVPFLVQYARIFARSWNKARLDKGIAGIPLRAKVLLFLGGCQVCWVAKKLECMTSLWTGLSFNAARSLDVDTILDFNFNEGWV
jgi:hypothetical protein